MLKRIDGLIQRVNAVVSENLATKKSSPNKRAIKSKHVAAESG